MDQGYLNNPSFCLITDSLFLSYYIVKLGSRYHEAIKNAYIVDSYFSSGLVLKSFYCTFDASLCFKLVWWTTSTCLSRCTRQFVKSSLGFPFSPTLHHNRILYQFCKFLPMWNDCLKLHCLPQPFLLDNQESWKSVLMGR